MVGLHKAPTEIDLATVLSKELTIRGALAYPNEFPQVIEMLQKIDLDPALLATHTFALSDFDDAFRTAQDPSKALKVLVDCQR